MSKYFTYELRNPITNLPFYIGFGQNGRPTDHIREALSEHSEFKKGSNPHKIYTIRQIHSQNEKVQINIIFYSDIKQEALDKEIELIKRHGRRDNGTGILTNMTDGGEGSGTRVYSKKERLARKMRRLGKTYEELFGEETAMKAKEKISKKKLGVKTNKPAWNTGKTKDTDESVKKISDSLQGREPPNKGCKMIELNPDYINSFLGRSHTDETKELMRSKAKERDMSGDNNPMYGKSVITGRKSFNDGNKNYFLFETDQKIVELNLLSGWLPRQPYRKRNS